MQAEEQPGGGREQEARTTPAGAKRPRAAAAAAAAGAADTAAIPLGSGALALLRDSYRAAVQRRKATGSDGGGGGGSDAQQQRRLQPALVLANARVWDSQAGRFLDGARDVVARGGRIERVAPAGQGAAAVAADEAAAGGAVIDCAGAFLLPGLCDAHVHATAVTADLAALRSLPESLVTAGAAEVLEGMLLRGFTAVRDAGGADWGLAKAVDDGLVLGPRVLFTGHALSQTGGHGDFRAAGEDACACGAALRGIGRVCDGVGECRRAARDELRRGAHCIKVMASGGVASPTDRLANTQFALDELTAIVEEAAAAGTYVCAHAYTPAAITRALQCGVKSIEHGNWLDEETADAMAARGAVLVPTTVTYQALRDDGERAGMPRALVAKVADAVERGLAAVRLARARGVRMAFGSDLLGSLHARQCEEFLLRAKAGVPPAELVAHATANAGELFGLAAHLEARLGVIEAGAAADLVLYSSDPSDPATGAGVLAHPERHLRLVVKGGLVAAAPGGEGGGGEGGATLAGVNARL